MDQMVQFLDLRLFAAWDEWVGLAIPLLEWPDLALLQVHHFPDFLTMVVGQLLLRQQALLEVIGQVQRWHLNSSCRFTLRDSHVIRRSQRSLVLPLSKRLRLDMDVVGRVVDNHMHLASVCLGCSVARPCLDRGRCFGGHCGLVEAETHVHLLLLGDWKVC